MILWNNETEILFFTEALKNFASPEQLFYNLRDGYFAYVPKGADAEGQTLQSRNSLIGQFTEKWSKTLFEPIANELGLYAVNGVVCDELGLSRQSNADLAFCTTNSTIQKPENVKLLFEIKMSVISNYKYTHPNAVEYVGDYKQHKGNPALLRSDSMLKAIGKSINIRVSGHSSTRIPVVVLGNSPITDSYIKKVDFLKTSGVVQGFWSLNPNPANSNYVKNTPKLGFQTILNRDQLFANCKELVTSDMNYFSSMISKSKLGEIITIANQEAADVAKAEKFLTLIRS
jgi:phosphotransferase system IIB component